VKVIGYARVSTAEQVESRAGLTVQHNAITAEAARRGWELIRIYEDLGLSGGSLTARGGLRDALAALQTQDADVLMVAKVDRLSRSLRDFAGLLELSRSQGWALIALDLGVDTSTPQGEMLANVLAVFSQFERRLIGQRTSEAFQVKKSQGVQLGRPRQVPDEVLVRVRELRSDGLSLRAIAGILDDDGVATGHGAPTWSGEAVRRMLNARLMGLRRNAVPLS
jgi:DNA invertase Pin-like site-specific DNA recombinase